VRHEGGDEVRSRLEVQAVPDVHDRREVRVEASLSRTRALGVLALALGGCNTPPKEAHDGATIPPSTSAPVGMTTPSAPAAAPPASSGSCAKDDDCRTFSSYCAEAPCACRVVAATDPPPRCLGAAASNVRCFADPCMNKAARCQGGACVLTAR
jgi:hypothetical protein